MAIAGVIFDVAAVNKSWIMINLSNNLLTMHDDCISAKKRMIKLMSNKLAVFTFLIKLIVIRCVACRQSNNESIVLILHGKYFASNKYRHFS